MQDSEKMLKTKVTVSIEPEMYKQYIAELRAKRAANFEARNVQNFVKL